MTLQDFRGVLHPEGKRRRVVDYDMPILALERIDLVQVPITDQLRHAFRQSVVATATVEHRHLVAAGQRIPHLMWPGQSRSAEDEDVERLRRRRDRPCWARQLERDGAANERGLTKK